ncbi:MAG: hypothetical protein IJ499_05380 [Clostridia bacterium]|nr:hypothetical protein [Clostridia bacterium]
MIIYCIILFLVNVVAAVVFHNSLNISAVSALPLFLLCLSAFQSYYFYNHRAKADFNINNDSELTEGEWGVLSVYMSRSYLVSLPLYVPFIIFGGLWIKVLSVAVFFAAFVGGAAVYKHKYRDKIAERIDKEAEELTEQKKREELGEM